MATSEPSSAPRRLNSRLILGLSFTGVIMGLLSSLVGLPQHIELPVWIASYVVWVIAVVKVGSERPFLDVLLGSLLSGVFVSTVQSALFSSYVANNPWYAEDLPDTMGAFAGAAVPFALGMGLFWGVLIGGIATLVMRRRGAKA